MTEAITNSEKKEVKQFRCGDNILCIESHFLGEAKLGDLLREHIQCRYNSAKRAPANQFTDPGSAKGGCQ